MPILITPDNGIPLPIDTTPEELSEIRDRAKLAVETIKALIEAGGEVEVTEEDRSTARNAIHGRSIKIKEENAGSILHLETILSEYDRELLNASTRLRTYITNKLLIETVDPDPKIRLKALELLGKTSNVGAFSERLEVNITHRTVEQIDGELTRLLERYMGPVDEVKAETADELDLILSLDDDELGITDIIEDIENRDVEDEDAEPSTVESD
jgi:hypothetical protein